MRDAQIVAGGRDGGNRYIIEPFSHKGSRFRFAIAHPDIVGDLMEDASFRGELANGLTRGNLLDHKLFAGAAGISNDGLVLFANDRCATFNDGGPQGNVDGGLVTIFGNKALCLASVGLYGPTLSY